MSKDYYKILGVEKTAGDAELKKAFRDLAKKYHPDVNKDDKGAEQKFKEINEAYAVLSDSEKRQQYDTFGAEGFGQRYSQEDIFSNFDFNSAFSDIFGGSGVGDDVFSRIFGGRRGRRGAGGPKVRFSQGPGGFGGFDFGGLGQQPGGAAGQGQDFEAQIEISLQEAHLGGSRRVSLRAESGPPIEVDVRIPPGIRDGKKLRLAGKGGPSHAGGPPGDLLLNVRILPDDRYAIDGDDLVAEAPVKLTTLVLGGAVEVTTLDGATRSLKVRPETSNGSRMRIRGYGLRIGKDRRGDLYVKLKASLPHKITPEQKLLFEQLEKLGV
jgi:curved DNA-binding protein